MRPKRERRYRSGEKALPPEQQRAMLAAVDRYRDEVLLRLELALGCRRADIVRIRWGDVNESQNSVAYREKKKGDAVHTAYVNTDIVAMLRKWREFSRDGYVFSGGSGGHLSDRTAYNIFNRALRRAGVSKGPWPFHALRATCVKNCQRAGWPPEATARHINDTIEVVQAHYSVPSPEERKQLAVEKPIGTGV